MAGESVRQQLRDFLAPHFPNYELGDAEDIFHIGYVNSLFAMQLIAFVEQAFGIRVESADLEFDNFRSVDSLVRLVESKNVAVR